MPHPPFRKGLHNLGDGCHAWLQPDGGWGWSNAGLIVDRGETLLVDTLFDLKLTREMLEAMRKAVPASAAIGTLVNTHSNGDHTFGNQLVYGAQIIASRRCAEEMREHTPESVRAMMADWKSHGAAGAFMHEVMGSRFDFEGVVLTPPTREFSGDLSLRVGDTPVELVEVGPAHTKGDVIVHVPSARTVFTGDILFVDAHPVVWLGPYANWIGACDRILGWDVETVVPGHGPVTDKAGVRRVKRYLEYVYAEARKRFDAGLSDEEAARDIAWTEFRDWRESERIFPNVNTAYREFQGGDAPRDVMRLFDLMGRWHNEHRHDHD